MPIEEMEKRVEELRNNLVRVLGRVHELEGLEDFADSIELVMANSDSIGTISIDAENWYYTLTIGALNIGSEKELRYANRMD